MTAYDRRCQQHADAAASALDQIAAIRRAAREYEIHERSVLREQWDRHFARVRPAQYAAMKAAGATLVDWGSDPVGQTRRERWQIAGRLFLVTYTLDAITCVPTEPSGLDLVDVRGQLGGVISD